MKPSKMIMHGRREYSLIFFNVSPGDTFRFYDAFDQPADVAIIRTDSVKAKTEYYNSQEYKDLERRLDLTQNKIMDWHTAFNLKDMPEMKMLYVCTWQHNYQLILFTGYDFPFLMNTDTRRREDESIDSIRELAEDFLQEQYGNPAITLEPIYEDSFYDFDYGCPYCGWKGDIEDAIIDEVADGAEEPLCPECEEQLIRMESQKSEDHEQ